jgi:hypothetical protein
MTPVEPELSATRSNIAMVFADGVVGACSAAIDEPANPPTTSSAHTIEVNRFITSLPA